MLSSAEREELIRRRGYCDRCGKHVTPGAAEVHHRNREPNDDRASNLRVLCKACHHTLHG